MSSDKPITDEELDRFIFKIERSSLEWKEEKRILREFVDLRKRLKTVGRLASDMGDYLADINDVVSAT